MSVAKRIWLFTPVLLIAVIITSGIIAWSKYSPGQPIKITLVSEPELQGEIYVSGAVTNPGLYSLKAGDTLESVLGTAVTSSDADLNNLKLYVPELTEKPQPQQIDINRAEAWLLAALPGIGETRAAAIIEYRQQHGLFRNTAELTRVEGIGTGIFEKIKSLVTVSG